MINVVCVLNGGVYTKEYVDRLHEGVSKNLKHFNFICFDETNLLNDYPGWWAKTEIFRLKGKNLYFDLDTVINGDLSEIAEYPHKFTMLKDFIQDYPASGVMAWDGDYSSLYHEFKPEHMEQYKRGGDGEYIRKRVKPELFQSLFPGQFASYKMNSKKERQEARVICYHGKPKPHETDWSV